jgi:hypothetical protein
MVGITRVKHNIKPNHMTTILALGLGTQRPNYLMVLSFI